jgi:hypothetical protein
LCLSWYMHFLCFVQYFVPLILISFAYIRIAVVLWGSKTPGAAQDHRDAIVLRNKKKVVKVLMVVVVLFTLAWLPLQGYYVAQSIFPQINTYKYINILWFCAHWLAMSNSCYNPFIYVICHVIAYIKEILLFLYISITLASTTDYTSCLPLFFRKSFKGNSGFVLSVAFGRSNVD